MTAHGEPSATTWTRLEPQHRANDLREGAAAVIADPAWLLARQWQFGEFHGSDGGSPASARLRLKTGALSGYRGLGPDTDGDHWHPYADTSLPLETLVESATPSEVDLSWRADGGRRFLRLLDQHGVGSLRAAFTAAFPLPAQADAGPLALVLRRVPDGAALARAFGDGAEPVVLPTSPAVPPGDVPAVLAAATVFVQWWLQVYERPRTGRSAQAWQPRRMEHRFALGAKLGSEGTDVTLMAPEYPGGSLDWYDLEVAGDGTWVPAAEPGHDTVRTVVPTPARFAGMPSDRFWAFEDARVYLGGIEAGGADLGRLLLGEFALIYSGDWFVVPIELRVGSVARVASLVVTDTFGVKTLIRPAAHADWDMFRLRGSTVDDALFVLPPSLPDHHDGAPVEEVLLLRDGAANVAWAVERLVEGATGDPIDRHEQYLAALRSAPASTSDSPQPPPGAQLDYRLRSAQPPAQWIPLVAQDASDGLRLRRSALPDAGQQPIQPLGELLGSLDWLAAEEVPADGARIVRHWQLARWHDGSTHLWLSRRKYAGRGEASSGLRYDVLTRVPPTP